jgi:chromosome segregation ATPase
LKKECQQIVSKQNLKLSSFPNIELNQLALIVLYSLDNQHLTDEAKQLYNETVIRALKEEYELINTEKNELMEQLNLSQEELNNLQLKYDEFLKQIELERGDFKQAIKDLTEKYEKQLEVNRDTSHEDDNKLNEEKNYGELEREYKQLRQDFDNVNNEYELVKDYNSQMYQEQMQGVKNNGKTYLFVVLSEKFSCDERTFLTVRRHLT